MLMIKDGELDKKEKKNLTNLIQFQNRHVGRRIVDVDYFGKQFNRGCSYCGGVLRFNICNEVVRGLASVLSFRCSKCYKTTNISTSDTVDVDDNAPYSVNAKVALGKYVIILI